MGFRDRFGSKAGEPEQPPETSGNHEPTVQPIFQVTEAEMAYWHAVKFANKGVANQVKRGEARHMAPEMQAWFVEHAGQPANPTQFGVMWYLHQDPGNVQLVDHRMLVANGMDKPENQPGTMLWAIEPGVQPSSEASERKARSMARLEQRQVPTIDHLPVLEDSTEAVLRTVDEIADRAVCLMAVSIKAEVFNEGDVVEWHPTLLSIIDSYGIARVLSPNERAFADNLAPDQQTATQFIWRYEALTALLWALGFLDQLDYPSAICDVPKVVGIVKEHGPEGLKSNARPRTVHEVLDQADFIYRLHWAVRQAQLGQGSPVAGTEPGVVMERHHSLHWLLESRNEDWDCVSTST